MITKLILENFRCFKTKQEIPIAPLTLLVGENSTGKTSLLAAYKLAWNIIYGREETDFNEVPFQLGSYDQIVNNRGGKNGQAKSFTIGAVSPKLLNESEIEGKEIYYSGTFEKRGAQPAIVSKQFKFLNLTGSMIISEIETEKQSEKIYEFLLELAIDSKKYEDKFRMGISRIFPPWDLIYVIFEDQLVKENENLLTEKQLDDIRLFFSGISSPRRKKLHPQPYAIAPIRTAPKRTYDPMKDTFQPSGEHVPFLLARIKRTERKNWEALKNRLEKFGSESGLFKSIDIKEKGKELGDPFQIHFKIDGKMSNLIDVGYGVSQVLPILVETLLASKGQTFLLQQPEVHLHPRAQAELGSYLGALVKQEKKNFIIETHSDYIIDRVRMDIRDKKPGSLRPDDVVILYFQREGTEINVHPIRIDEMGNICDAPKGYRQFFLDEERRFFGV